MGRMGQFVPTADCLLKNTSTKENTYVFNQKLKHCDDISFRERFGRIRVFVLQSKICPFQHKICVSTLPIHFYEHSWPNSLNLSFSLECGIYVHRVQKSKILMILKEEMSIFCIYSNKSLDFI